MEIIMLLKQHNDNNNIKTSTIVIRTVIEGRTLLLSANSCLCMIGTNTKPDTVLFGKSPRWLQSLFGTPVDIIVSIFYDEESE
jgi:hypothetical protein